MNETLACNNDLGYFPSGKSALTEFYSNCPECSVDEKCWLSCQYTKQVAAIKLVASVHPEGIQGVKKQDTVPR